MEQTELFVVRAFERFSGSFLTATMLPDDEAYKYSLDQLKDEEVAKLSTKTRSIAENMIRDIFVKKGGHPKTDYALYFHIGTQPHTSVLKWFKNPAFILVPLSIFSNDCVSFTYDDSITAIFRKDNHPSRRKIYMKSDIPMLLQMVENDIVSKPQFIEMQLWNPECIKDYEKYIKCI